MTDRIEWHYQLYNKYKDKTMLPSENYVTNLALAESVNSRGCVVECGVWKGGISAGMAEVLGPDRLYFLFDSFRGHVPPQPIDGPAAFAWQADKQGPWYFNKYAHKVWKSGSHARNSKVQNFRNSR